MLSDSACDNCGKDYPEWTVHVCSTEETICGARASRCVCIKPEGHVKNGDDIHVCDPIACGGSWRGDFETDYFYVVTFPLIDLPR